MLEAIESGGGEARIHLQPRELGDVVIHVRTHGDRVEVMVQAERSEAVNVIREHAQDLTGLLGQSGLNLADLNVSLGMQQQGRGWRGEPTPLPNNRLRDDSEFAAVLGTDPTVASTNQQAAARYLQPRWRASLPGLRRENMAGVDSVSNSAVFGSNYTKSQSDNMGQVDFMRLLVAQMRNQNPLEPQSRHRIHGPARPVRVPQLDANDRQGIKVMQAMQSSPARQA